MYSLWKKEWAAQKRPRIKCISSFRPNTGCDNTKCNHLRLSCQKNEKTIFGKTGVELSAIFCAKKRGITLGTWKRSLVYIKLFT